MAKATDAAKDLAAERNVDVAEIDGSGQEGKVTKADVREAAPAPLVLARANPSVTTYKHSIVDGYGNPRDFYADPYSNPNGAEAQMVTEEEFALFNAEVDGLDVLVKDGGEG
jgi:pyruvate/2-oxoglutarate dehydrogenase complex dihydrolipoamide acyltransferase (E2) component